MTPSLVVSESFGPTPVKQCARCGTFKWRGEPCPNPDCPVVESPHETPNTDHRTSHGAGQRLLDMGQGSHPSRIPGCLVGGQSNHPAPRPVRSHAWPHPERHGAGSRCLRRQDLPQSVSRRTRHQHRQHHAGTPREGHMQTWSQRLGHPTQRLPQMPGVQQDRSTPTPTPTERHPR